MNLQDAVNDIARRLSLLNDRQLIATGSTLQQADMTWNEWCNELAVRVGHLRHGPSQDVLDALGALVVAFKIKLAEADEVSVASGEAA